MRSIIPLIMVAGLAGCTYGPPPAAQQANAQAKLNATLAGLVPGQPTECIPHYVADRQMITIDPDTLLFKYGSTVYRNEIPGGCNGLGNSTYALVTHSGGPGLCRGDIAQVRDLQTGMMVGACTMGSFTPYRRPGA